LLVGAVEASGVATSHLLLKPLSPPAVRKLKAAFNEIDPDNDQLVADPELLAHFEPLAQIALAHVALEEVRFALTG